MCDRKAGVTVYYRVWTLMRGILDPPEPLDAENDKKAVAAQILYEESKCPSRQQNRGKRY